MSDADKKYVDSLIHRAIGLLMLNQQSDDFLRFIDDLKRNPNPDAIATLSRWNQGLEAHLANRVEQSRQPQLTPATEFVVNRLFIN